MRNLPQEFEQGTSEGLGMGAGRRRGGSQSYGDEEEPLFGRRILCALIDLFPEREVVVRTAVHFVLERDARHPVEHKIR